MLGNLNTLDVKRHHHVDAYTASVGVTNRLDPIQSIYGGAQYISDLKSTIDYGTSSGDKIAFLLASYNLGTTNIRNAINAIDKKPIEVTWLDLERYLLNVKTSIRARTTGRTPGPRSTRPAARRTEASPACTARRRSCPSG